MLHRRLFYLLLVVALLISGPGAGPAARPPVALPSQNSPQLTELAVKVAPGIDLQNYISTAPFRLIFSEPMDPASASPALLTYPYLPGELSWSPDNTELTFTPTGSFQASRSYYIFLDRDLKSAARKLFTRIQQWQINVLPGPAMLSYSPVGPELLDLRPRIQVTFDRAMDRESVVTAIRTEPPVAFDVEWKDRQVILHPRQPLAPGQNYRIAIAKTARDTNGVPLDREETWQYWVPELQASVEMEDARTIQMKFNYNLAARPAVPPFEITPPLEGKWSWAGSLAVFKAAQAIPLAMEYTTRATAELATAGGDPLSMRPVTFVPDAPILTVGQEGDWVDPNEKKLYIVFDIPMNHPSAEAAFHVSPAVKGHFTWDNNQLIYLLDESMEGSTTYTVSLDPSAHNADGQPVMLSPYTWTFTTAYSYQGEVPAPVFGCWGGNAQVVDAGGPRTIAVQGRGENNQMAFSLYRVDLPQFVALYRTYFKYRGDYYTRTASDLIPTDGLERAAYWQVKTGSGLLQTVLPVEVPTGVYVLNASMDGVVLDQLLVSLTYKTIVAKYSGSRLWLWASDINGEDAPDLEVRLYTRDGSLMREGKTGDGGIFETTLPKDSPPMLVAVRGEGDDISIAGFDGQWRSNWWDAAATHAVTAYIYTDRPIYRPGHTLNYKVIVRNDDDVRYSVPESGTPVKVRVLDPRGNEVQVDDLPTNEFGTVSGSFTVAEGAGLGEYQIQAGEDSATVYGSVVFKVEDYRKPDFQVLLSGEKDRYIAGEAVTIDIDTRYFFGEPLPNAELTIRTFGLQSRYWWSDAEDHVPEESYTWYPSGESQVRKADQKGHYQYLMTAFIPGDDGYYYGFHCQTSWRSSLRRCTLGIEVTAKDTSGQEVSGVRIIDVYNAAEKYDLDAGDWLKGANEKFAVTARAVALDTNQPVANRKLRLDVTGRIWNGWSYDYSVVTSYDLVTSADGAASLEIAIEKPGSYSLRLSPRDGDVTRVAAWRWLYIYSGKDTWASSSWSSFSITADRAQYKPYQKARLAIQSGFSGPALLTFERGRVIHEQPVMLTAPLTMVETEIIPEYAPNVYVVINAWKPQSMELDSAEYSHTRSNSVLSTERVELQVEASQKILNIAITPDKTGYAPRQEATFAVQVTDAQNQPVEAEFSLALVDEAIFTLSGDLAGPIYEGFYGRRDLGVSTADSLAITRWLGYCSADRGGGGEEVGPANPRSDFPDTAAWYPALRTDKDGKASLTLTLPDSLTTWRVLVKAVTKQTQVGDGELKIVTHQEVVAQPVLPRTLTTGDQVELGVLVHNYTGQPRELMVDLAAAGLEVLGISMQRITLQAGEVQMVRWQVRANEAGETSIDITAASPQGQDAVRVPLEVRPRAMPDVATQVGDFQGELLATLVVPETMLDISTVEVKLSRSEAGSLLDGLEYLTGYPYGCVEQTMSRALPNAVVLRALDRLGMDSAFKDRLNEMIGQGVQRLYGFQHRDGGWGWWHDDDSTAYQTAWVVFGLSVTAEAGYPVDPKVIERGAKYLKEQLGPGDGEGNAKTVDPRTQAYVLYSLAVAGQGDKEQTVALAGQSAVLDAFSQAALALALDRLEEDSAARAVLDGLARSAIRGEGQVYWESAAEDGEYYDKTMSSPTRTTALALSAFTKIAPGHELVPGMVRYLMSKRRAAGWGTTNETAYTVLALTDHLQALQAAGAAADYQVLLNDQPLADGRLDGKAPLATLTIAASQLKPGINLLKITQTGADHLFYTITNRMFLDTPAVEAAGAVRVLREYLDPQTGRPLQKVEAGDLVRVRLTARFPSPESAYLIIEDHLPGGLEALNERLNTTSHYGGAECSDDYCYQDSRRRYFWQEYGYNQKEIYADLVSFFITGLHSTTYTVDYLARAGRPGTFTAPPAQIYAMYDETLWGRSASGTIIIEP